MLDKIKGFNEAIKVKLNASNKVTLAGQVTGHLTRENNRATSDLATQLDKVCAKLRDWNGLAGNLGSDLDT